MPVRRADDQWIADYLQDMLRRRIRTARRLGLLSRDASNQRAIQLGLLPLDAPSGVQWADLGLDYVVVGTVQRVLDTVAVRVRVLNRDGDVLKPSPFAATLNVKEGTPAEAIAPVVAATSAALGMPAGTDGSANPDATWGAVERVYRLAAQADRADTPEVRAKLIADLEPVVMEPGVSGLAFETVALLRLQQALLTLKDEDQMRELGLAAEAAKRAVEADPDNTEWRALLGEIYYFLKQDYQARTEASVARLKNPLEGLAWTVLALLAGPSTGEGTDDLKRARQADPFLWGAARAPGTPPFQGGVLEPTLSRWADRHAPGASGPKASARIAKAESQALREGMAAFEAKRWDVADAAFRKAADEDEYDYRPVLYQLRILIEQGRAADAVGPLRDLATENPQENEVLLYLGIALEKAAAYDDARQAFQRILQEEPHQPLALLHLGITTNAQRAWNDAVEPLRTLVGIQPRNQEAWLQLGFAQANLEQWTGADESFRQVLAINPNSQVARDWRAKIRPHLPH